MKLEQGGDTETTESMQEKPTKEEESAFTQEFLEGEPKPIFVNEHGIVHKEPVYLRILKDYLNNKEATRKDSYESSED